MNKQLKKAKSIIWVTEMWELWIGKWYKVQNVNNLLKSRKESFLKFNTTRSQSVMISLHWSIRTYEAGLFGFSKGILRESLKYFSTGSRSSAIMHRSAAKRHTKHDLRPLACELAASSLQVNKSIKRFGARDQWSSWILAEERWQRRSVGGWRRGDRDRYRSQKGRETGVTQANGKWARIIGRL